MDRCSKNMSRKLLDKFQKRAIKIIYKQCKKIDSFEHRRIVGCLVSISFLSFNGNCSADIRDCKPNFASFTYSM